MEPTPVFACKLDPSGFRARRPQWEALNASLLQDRFTWREATFVFSPGARATVEQFVRDESACCEFFDFRTEEVAEGLALTVSVPGGGEPMLAALAASLSGHPGDGVIGRSA